MGACERCGTRGGMLLADDFLKAARGCLYCGHWDWGGGVVVGDKAGSQAIDADDARTVREWAAAAGLGWGGADDSPPDADGAALWLAAFQMSLADFGG